MKKSIYLCLMLLVIFSIAHPWGIVAANDFQPAAMVPAAESEIGALGPKTYLPIVFLLNGTYLAGCAVFPADNVWNTPVDNLPVLASSDSYINNIGKNATFHADFGSGLWQGAPIGIPFVVVPSSQPNVAIHYTNYGNESDPGPFPIPANAPIEGGSGSSGDRHVLVLENGSCMLYELYNAHPQPNGDWNASSGAKYDLKANGPLRTAGWTSADAAGLPILPGLARYDEVAVGEIRHALRFTVPCTANNYIWPARHRAGSCGSGYPPMGQRFRLKASFNVASAPAQVQVILRAMKKYGIIVADNGSAWYITGEPNPGWDNDQLHWLDSHLHGSDIEAVDTSSMILDPNSGQARQP